MSPILAVADALCEVKNRSHYMVDLQRTYTSLCSTYLVPTNLFDFLKVCFAYSLRNGKYI
jgi:hypothetical protein